MKVLAVDLGGTHATCALVEDQTCVDSIVLDYRAAGGLQPLMPEIVTALRGVCSRADFKRLRCGPGDVPEDCDARLGEAIFQHPRQQGKMIVLNKDHGILFAGDFLDESVGKLLVDCVVVFPIRSAKDGAGVGDVAERPETFIGKSVIVASFLLAA